MFPNEYEVKAHRRDLLQQAEQQRLARQLVAHVSLGQRAGQSLLKLGARFAARDGAECLTLETQGQVVTVCSAA